MSLLQTRLRWQKINGSGREARERVAVLSTFTADPLVPYLGTALEDAGLPAAVWVGPFDQVVQECLAAGGRTSEFGPTALLVWPRLEDLWRGRQWPLNSDPDGYASEALELATAASEAATRWRATLIFVLPSVPELRPLGAGDACNPAGVFATATRVRETLRGRLAARPGTLLLDAEEVVRRVGTAAAYNPSLEVVARIPYSEQFFDAVGERAGRLLSLDRRPARKVVAVDGDRTLWGGVVGEDGAAHVDLNPSGPGEAHLGFQSFLLELRRAGVLISFVSKNTEADAWAVFARPEMRLKREHLSGWRINWDSKADGLRGIAADLGLGLDSFAFVDDSPAEVAEMEASLPEVACVRMPQDAAQWLGAMQESGVFDRLPPTAEDLARPSQYEGERLRKEQLKDAAAGDYLSNLGVRVRVFEPGPDELPRLAQLVAKTNQMNLNCRRRTSAELAELCADESYLVRAARVEDRFGDYGLVGLSVARREGASAELDTFLLSCRAMGRGVEEAMLASLFEELERAGAAAELFAAAEEHARNEPARRFFARLGCEESGKPRRLSRPVWPSHVERA